MKTQRCIFRAALIGMAIVAFWSPGMTQADKAQQMGVGGHTFVWKGRDFLLDGKPFTIRSGEMHYPRVPRAYWRDRFRKARAMGLNTITTYVFWNLHEPVPGQFDFGGNLDVAEFIRQAGQEGLFVIVRPGPYICTEWDFGGFPAWLLKTPDMKVRSSEKRFLDAASRYIKDVGRRLAPLQVTHGGNVIMTQVENEYGSFGSDHGYMAAVRDMIRNAGFNVPLFTSDGGSKRLLDGGTLPNVLSVVNFGAEANIANEFAEHNTRWPETPRMIGEYWIGWFDHWGEKRHTVAPEVPAKGVDWMLSNGYSFNIYMFHGGTTFGFMAGANSSRDMPIQPDTSSYDYDSPLDEAGRPTRKFFALRDVIQRHFPQERFPDLPAEKPLIEIPAFDLDETAPIDHLLNRAREAVNPLTMESLDQSYGFLLYRKRIGQRATGKLSFGEIRDYAVVSQGMNVFGSLDRRLKQTSVDVDLSAGTPLDILVENMGRINFGPRMVDDRKGMIGPVTLAGEELRDWQIFSLPLTDLSRLRFSRKRTEGPAFYRGYFTLSSAGDTFFDMTTWEKGHVWINGHHLGRFWKIGPQQTLYVPAAWLKKGRNEVMVLDVGKPQKPSVRGLRDQIFANQ